MVAVVRFMSSLWRSPLPWLVLAAPLAGLAIAQILASTGRQLAVPLDDAFIHFQYASAFRTGHFFSYTAGASPASGSSSLLWPLLLALLQSVGFTGQSTIVAAWGLGWVALALSAYETARLAEGFGSRVAAASAGLLQLTFAANAWFASSGMEVLLLAWALVRTTRRTCEWVENGVRGSVFELLGLALACPLVRPEGVLGSGLVALAIATFARGRLRLSAGLAVFFGSAPWVVNWLVTGSASSTTARVKFLWFNPYLDLAGFARTTLEHVSYFFEVLLDGGGQSSLFMPRGSRLFALLGLLAIVVAGRLAQRRWRAFSTLVLALGVLLPTTYDGYIINRLRYFWPFVPAWFVGIGALIHVTGLPLARLHPRAPVAARLTLGLLFLAALGRHFKPAIADLGQSSAAILGQQVSLAQWAKRALPKSAVLGVNDAGALAYVSERRTFDIVGLTTQGEARYWNAGAGSRFEHYERLGRARLPTHFVVHPGWLQLDLLLGPCLTERVVPQASILGGPRMVACAAQYSWLGSGALPSVPPSSELVDELDVADLESEESHRYVVLPARKLDDYVLTHQQQADGGRARRASDDFFLKLEPAGTLVLRVGAARKAALQLQIGGSSPYEAQLDGTSWQEIAVPLPATLARGTYNVRVTSADAASAFTAMHYWSFR